MAESPGMSIYGMAVYGPRGLEIVKYTSGGLQLSNGLEQYAEGSRSMRQIAGVRVAKRIIEPPHKWWQLATVIPVHMRASNAKARAVWGSGFSYSGGLADKAHPFKDVLERSAQHMYNAHRDLEITGWCNVELRETLSGELYCMEHVDSWACYRGAEEPLFVNWRGGSMSNAAKFANVEDDLEYGKWSDRPTDKEGAPLPRMVQLNNQHWPYNSYYGVPDIVASIDQMETLYEAIKLNREFFARRGGYRWMILLEENFGNGGGVGEQELVGQIHYHLERVGKEGSTADILTIPIGNRKATLHKLDADVKDMDYSKLMKNYREDILAAHGVPPFIAGYIEVGALGGEVAAEQVRVYRDETVLPKQQQWETLLNQLVQAYWPGADLKVALTDPKIDERAVNLPYAGQAFADDAINLNEYRAFLGLDDDEKRGELYSSDLPGVGEYGPAAIAATRAQPRR